MNKPTSVKISWHKQQIVARTREYNEIAKNPSSRKNPQLLMSSRLYFIRHHYNEMKLLLANSKLQEA